MGNRGTTDSPQPLFCVFYHCLSAPNAQNYTLLCDVWVRTLESTFLLCQMVPYPPINRALGYWPGERKRTLFLFVSCGLPTYIFSLWMLLHQNFFVLAAAESSFQIFHHLQISLFATPAFSWDARPSRPILPFFTAESVIGSSPRFSCSEIQGTSATTKRITLLKGLSFSSLQFLLIPPYHICFLDPKYDSSFLQLIPFWYLSILLMTFQLFS